MNLQHERIADLCRQLGLMAMEQAWPHIADHHLQQEGTYADFVEQLLMEEIKAKHGRTQSPLCQTSWNLNRC